MALLGSKEACGPRIPTAGAPGSAGAPGGEAARQGPQRRAQKEAEADQKPGFVRSSCL